MKNPYYPPSAKMIKRNFEVSHWQYGKGFLIGLFENDEAHVIFKNFNYTQKDKRARHHRLSYSKLLPVEHLKPTNHPHLIYCYGEDKEPKYIVSYNRRHRNN